MGEDIEVVENNSSALFITDSFKNAVHGISVFANFFVEDVLKKEYKTVVVLEYSTKQIFVICRSTSFAGNFSNLYVNANYSQSDLFVHRNGFADVLQSMGLNLANEFRKHLISHGWPKIKFRWNYYGIYYAIKNYKREKGFDRLKIYDELIFISTATDQYRHKDFDWACENNISRRFYNFSENFIQHCKLPVLNIDQSVSSGSVMIIANFESVKNVWWMPLYNLRRKLANKKQKRFVVLMKGNNGFSFSVFKYLAKKNSIQINQDQNKKFELLSSAQYLFIPSFTEYNPIVGLEATACNKKIVSLYKITALAGKNNYHYISE